MEFRGAKRVSRPLCNSWCGDPAHLNVSQACQGQGLSAHRSPSPLQSGERHAIHMFVESPAQTNIMCQACGRNLARMHRNQHTVVLFLCPPSVIPCSHRCTHLEIAGVVSWQASAAMRMCIGASHCRLQFGIHCSLVLAITGTASVPGGALGFGPLSDAPRGHRRPAAPGVATSAACWLGPACPKPGLQRR